MERIRWITHKEKKVLYADYKGLTNDDEVLSLFLVEAKFMVESPTKVLSLADYTGVNANKRIMAELKRLGNEVYKVKCEKTAVLGVTGIKAVLLITYNMLTKHQVVPFNSEQEALDYLAE
jgi:hypothetical protein